MDTSKKYLLAFLISLLLTFSVPINLLSYGYSELLIFNILIVLLGITGWLYFKSLDTIE